VTITLREILWVGFWLAVVMAFLFDNLNPFLRNRAITYPFKCFSFMRRAFPRS
jgi:hypothetical protein